MSHLDELRRVGIKIAGSYVITALIMIYFSAGVLDYFLLPVKEYLPNLVFTSVLAPIMTQVRLAMTLGLLVCAPYFTLEFWRYINSALYPDERQAVGPLMVAALLLFYFGFLLGWAFLLPQIVRIAVGWSPTSIQLLIDVDGVVALLMSVPLICGLFCQVPLVMVLLQRLGLLRLETCVEMRRHVVVLALVLGMCFTPPDVIAQIILAVPLYGLFELGVFLMKYSHSDPAQSFLSRGLFGLSSKKQLQEKKVSGRILPESDRQQ